MKKSFLILLISSVAYAAPVSDSTAPLDAVVITASPFLHTLFEQAQPVTFLSGDNLKLRLETTVGETLSHEPGISSTYFGPGASRPIIRGLGDDRIRVLSNGVNMLDVANVSPDHQVTSDPLSIETIEVVRGPATLLYGPNSVGGVVNVIDGRIPTERLGKPVEGRFSGRFGTVDDEISEAGSLNFGLGPIVFHLDGFQRETQDVAIPGFARSERLLRISPEEKEADGTLPNSYVNSEGAAVGGSYLWEGGFIGASYTGVNSNYGTVAEREVHIDMAQRRFDARGAFFEPFAGIKTINYKFAYSNYDHTEFEGPLPGTLFEIEGYDGRVEIVHHKLGLLEGSIGYQIQRSEFSAVGEEAFLPPTSTTIHSGFVFEEIAFDKVRFQFGARSDHQSNDSTGGLAFGPARNVEFDSVSGSAGIVWTPVDEYAVALSLAYTERPPTYVELFANGPHVGTGSFEIGNADLGLEKSISLDLSLRKRLGRVTGSVSLFYNRFTDYIALTPNGATEDDLPVFLYDPVEASYYGGEGEVTFHILQPVTPEIATTSEDGKTAATPIARPPQTLDLDLKADYVRTEIRGGGSLPRIPPFRVQAALNYSRGSIAARIEGNYAARQNRIAEFELPTDSYFLLNASLSYRVPVGPALLDFYVKGTNLTDAEARLHTSFLKDIAPLPGRGVLFGVRADF